MAVTAWVVGKYKSLARTNQVEPCPELSRRKAGDYARGMSRSFFRHLRRCRVLFALALCAWLSLAGAAWAHADCCAGAGGVMTMAHHDAAPSSPHAGSVHVDCTCAHALAVLPELAPLAWRMSFATSVWQTGPAEAPDLPRAPPLRPPLA